MQFFCIFSIAAVSALVVPQSAKQRLANARNVETRPVAAIGSDAQQAKRQPTFDFMTDFMNGGGGDSQTPGSDILTRWLSAWRKMHGLPTESGAMPWTSPSTPSTPLPVQSPANTNNNGTSTVPLTYVPLPETPVSNPSPDPATPTDGKDDKSEGDQSTSLTADPASPSKEKREAARVPPFEPISPDQETTSLTPKRQTNRATTLPSGTNVGTGALVGNVGTGLAQLLPGPLGSGLNSLLKGVGSDIQAGRRPPPRLQRVQPIQPTLPTSLVNP